MAARPPGAGAPGPAAAGPVSDPRPRLISSPLAHLPWALVSRLGLFYALPWGTLAGLESVSPRFSLLTASFRHLDTPASPCSLSLSWQVGSFSLSWQVGKCFPGIPFHSRLFFVHYFSEFRRQCPRAFQLTELWWQHKMDNYTTRIGT